MNELLGLDDWTMAIEIFPEPFITVCFIDDDRLFINLFHNASSKHYHFIYNYTERKMEHGKPVERIMECPKKNFPYKCFYNDDKDEIYSFYRQGQSFTIKPDKMEDYVYDKMTDMDLGSMYLIYNKALVVRSSSTVLFFKQEWDEDLDVYKWK